jgi:hypothetical protein
MHLTFNRFNPSMKTLHSFSILVALALATSIAVGAETPTNTGTTTPGSNAPITPPGLDKDKPTPPGQDKDKDKGKDPQTPPTQNPPVTNTNNKTPPGLDKRHTPNENASDNAKAVQTLLKTFDDRRDQLMSERKTLLQKLETAASETEKKGILEQLRLEQQTRQEEQRTLRREIGEELKKLRDQRKGGGSN